MFELNYMPHNPGKIGLVLVSISEDELRLRRVLSNAAGHYLRSLLKGANIDPNSCPVTYMAMGVAIKGIYATIPTAIREQSKAALTLKPVMRHSLGEPLPHQLTDTIQTNLLPINLSLAYLCIKGI